MKKNLIIRNTYNQLKNDITFGKFSPGEHLSEKLLTEKYGVSRTSIREIIGQLSSQGYLTLDPNRGASVTKLSLEDIEITYEILCRCEGLAASLAARNAGKEIIDKLRKLLKEMEGKIYDSRSWLELNDIFHETTCMGCGRPILIELIGNIRLRIYRYRMVPTETKTIRMYHQHHKKIFSAISKGDDKQSEKLMISHLQSAQKNRIERIQKFPESF